jgi:hypothetical protein
MKNNNKEIQTVLFDKTKWDVRKSRKWLKDHNYISNGKLDRRGSYLRYRQSQPDSNGRYRSKKLENGIILVYEFGETKRGGANPDITREIVSYKISQYIRILNRCKDEKDKKDMKIYIYTIINHGAEPKESKNSTLIHMLEDSFTKKGIFQPGLSDKDDPEIMKDLLTKKEYGFRKERYKHVIQDISDNVINKAPITDEFEQMVNNTLNDTPDDIVADKAMKEAAKEETKK